MSILDDYEEISFSDDSTNNSEPFQKPKPIKSASKNPHSINLHKLKSNPNTFDYESLLKQIQRPSKFCSASPPVVDRLLFTHQLSQNKKRFLLQKQENEEKQACTFRPSIVPTSKPRSFKDFYSEQQQFLENRKTKLENLKEDKERKMRDSEVFESSRRYMSPGSKVIIQRTGKKKEVRGRFEIDSPKLLRAQRLKNSSNKVLGMLGNPLVREKFV